MTTSTVARYIDRTEAGIRGMLRRGAIPFVKRDGIIYFDQVEIDRWIRQGRRVRLVPSSRLSGHIPSKPPD
jgi:hypothetical protein